MLKKFKNRVCILALTGGSTHTKILNFLKYFSYSYLSLGLIKNINKLIFYLRFELLARLCPNSTGAEIRSVCTEAGMFAIRARRKVQIICIDRKKDR